mgnify:CR=1 FL=1
MVLPFLEVPPDRLDVSDPSSEGGGALRRLARRSMTWCAARAGWKRTGGRARRYDPTATCAGSSAAGGGRAAPSLRRLDAGSLQPAPERPAPVVATAVAEPPPLPAPEVAPAVRALAHVPRGYIVAERRRRWAGAGGPARGARADPVRGATWPRRGEEPRGESGACSSRARWTWRSTSASSSRRRRRSSAAWDSLWRPSGGETVRIDGVPAVSRAEARPRVAAARGVAGRGGARSLRPRQGIDATCGSAW